MDVAGPTEASPRVHASTANCWGTGLALPVYAGRLERVRDAVGECIYSITTRRAGRRAASNDPDLRVPSLVEQRDGIPLSRIVTARAKSCQKRD